MTDLRRYSEQGGINNSKRSCPFYFLFVLKTQWEVLVQGVSTFAQKLPTKGLVALAPSVPGSPRGAGCALSLTGLRAGGGNKA